MPDTPPLNQRWLWGGVAGLLLLLCITLNGEANMWLFQHGNRIALYSGDALWAYLTLLGDTLIVFALLLPFVARRPELIWAMFWSACVVTLMVHLGKEFIDSPRPAGVLPLESLHQIGYVATSSSFPSGHTAAAFTLSACIALLPFANSLKVAALLFAMLVGISRVAVGIHWPADVAGGALVGWLGAAMGCYLMRRVAYGRGVWGQRIQAVVLLLLAVTTIVFHDGGYPQARALNIVLPLIMIMLAMPGLRQLFSRHYTAREY